MPSAVSSLIPAVQINVPFTLLKSKYLPAILKMRINPEIGIDSRALDEFSPAQFTEIACTFRGEGLSVTLHAPFMDMVPGSPDPIMRSATMRRLRQAFELLPIFEPLSIVCHTGFDDQRYQNQVKTWVQTSVESWSPLIQLAQGVGTTVMLENVYEEKPDIHLALFSKLDTPSVRFCFDIGHWHVYGRTDMEDWLQKLRPYLGQLHLHDNLGKTDAHLAVGSGKIDFTLLFSFLQNFSPRPIITLEPHREEDVLKSLENLRTLWPWQE